MHRFLIGAGLVATLVALASAPTSPLNAQGKNPNWTTVKGRIIWDVKKAPAPPRQVINVQGNKPACLIGVKLLDEDLLINPKNQGIANVIIWIEPMQAGGNMPVHPNLKAIKNKQVEIDQPCCMFIPRVIAIREGQEVVVKNSATFAHNVRWTGIPGVNQGGNVNLVPAGGQHIIKDLKAQRLPLMVECNIHGWMRAQIGVFDHPYFAVTDADGNFEIPLAPQGNYKLMIIHEHGYSGGKKGREGQPIVIPGAPMMNLGDLKYNK